MRGIQTVAKRAFDYLFGIVLAVLSFPFLLLAMLIVRIASPEAPVLFRQERIGRKRRTITIYKIRSMTAETDDEGRLLPDEMRLKPWGKLIRKTNLDEIPQIFNILKNEMSLIGPRPLLPREMLVMSEEEQELRQSVFPGITGWEAVHEGESSSRREMAEFDLEYVRNWSLALDLKIIFMTAYIVLGFRRPPDAVRAPDIDQELDRRQEKGKQEP